MALKKNKNILIIPLDNRPVSYTIPCQTLQLNADVGVFIPPREIIGGLTVLTELESLFDWVENTLQNNDIDAIICCLDTIAYGGLIPSRRLPENFSQIQQRIHRFKNIISKQPKTPSVYAFSSIMRISNNNINEEEKSYWDEYGEKIFGYSYHFHKSQTHSDSLKPADELKGQIPPDILEDYLEARKRNLSINKYYLELAKDGLFKQLVFSQDDTAEYGLNVMEKNILLELIESNDLKSVANIKTGADEIPTSICTRAVLDMFGYVPRIFPLFLNEYGKFVVSRYEDITIEQSVEGQITLCGATVVDNEQEADIILIANTPQKQQNDLAMRVFPEEEDTIQVQKIIEYINQANKPIAIADLKNANGADNLLVQKLLENGVDCNKLFGYAGWNTTGNTLGSVISMAVSRFIAERESTFVLDRFKKLLFVRLVDDWAYQTVARQMIRAISSEADLEILDETLMPYAKNICKKLELEDMHINLSFPWDRTFEVEVAICDSKV